MSPLWRWSSKSNSWFLLIVLQVPTGATAEDRADRNEVYSFLLFFNTLESYSSHPFL